MKQYVKSAAYIFMLVLFAGCSLAQTESELSRKDHLTIASWNVQALFDGADNGHEYDEYRTGTGWNSEKYQARLNIITGAIKGSDGNEGFNPDILTLIEVENPDVLRDLAEMPGMDYRWTFFAGAPDGAIGLGVLSRFPLTKTAAHSVYYSGGSIPRPVAEVWVETGTGPVVLMICHWKSKLGGEKETEAARRAEAGIIARRLEEISAEQPETPVIILGDLNENHNEFDRIGGGYLCALLPDSDRAAEMAKTLSAPIRPGFQDYLVVSTEKPPRSEFFEDAEPALLFSPWKEGDLQGSYFYQDTWETIDHFLLNSAFFDKEGWEYESFRILDDSPFTNAQGIPYSYNPRTGSGVSDHLPIVLRLRGTQ
jgi:endonuclease/exonuclease/phosphatase family metal-dependent hydrolase